MTAKQRAAVDSLAKELEERGADPTVLSFSKPHEELDPEQQRFLQEFCQRKSKISGDNHS